jgi:uncharacterized protein
MYITRTIEPEIQKLMKQFRSVTITGPRQSGKSTLARHLYPDFKYVNLEDPSMLRYALDDPKGFLMTYSKGSIIDEIQKAPEILSYLQVQLDEDSDVGQYILTGSQNFALSKAVSQSMVGRTAVVTLLPLSLAEIRLVDPKIKLEDVIQKGCYPGVYSVKIDQSSFFSSYTALYLERDVRDLRQIGDLARFRDFIILVASRSGQLMNYSSISNDLGIDIGTVKRWLSVLEASYVIFKLDPLATQISRRIVRASKYYFVDTGLLCSLLDIRSSKILESHPLWGSIFETFIVSEAYKKQINKAENFKMYFLRDKTGNEIDIVETTDTGYSLTEVKASRTFNSSMIESLGRFDSIAKHGELLTRYLIYRGESMAYKDVVVKGVK